jgi:HSP20 family protein
MRREPGWGVSRRDLDRLFEDFFNGHGLAKRDGTSTVWSPSVDVHEDEQSFFIEAELPGMRKEDIQLEIENNVLSIRGERRLEKKEEKDNYHFVERSYGSFFRSFTLPKNVNTEAIGAEYKDGMLKLTLPKREEVKPRKLDIG